ncbi:MAG TPA: polysaccharide deacetylase family protein, partial [Acidimicrobiia bacterium]|nr:polysaccharide deacetylase family protein [Acidimicrobiia bacterium]
PLAGPRRGPRILIYHQVGADSGLEMDVSVHALGRQLDWVERHGRVVDLETALQGLDGPEADDMYVLTFDDGHAGVFEHAYPLLSGRGLPFTLYLTTGPIEGGSSLHDDARMRLLSWREVEEMMGSGLVTIGAHTHEHLDMRHHDEERLRQDLATCNGVLELRLGVKPRHFAYPWGHWSAAGDRLVRELYDSAVVGGGRGIRPGDDMYMLHRVPVMARDGDPLFRRKMWGGFRLENGLRDLRDSLAGSSGRRETS